MGAPLVVRRKDRVLLPFQNAGVRFLAERRFAILADDPGLGKTAQALGALRETDSPALVVVASNLCRNIWEAEIASSGLRVDRSGSGIFPSHGAIRVSTRAEIMRRRLSPRAVPLARTVLILDDMLAVGMVEGSRFQVKLAKLAEAFVRSDAGVWILSSQPEARPERFCELLATVGFLLRRHAVSVQPRRRR